MSEEQIEALINFVRREADFARRRSLGMSVSPDLVTESSRELQEALQEEIEKGP